MTSLVRIKKGRARTKLIQIGVTEDIYNRYVDFEGRSGGWIFPCFKRQVRSASP